MILGVYTGQILGLYCAIAGLKIYPMSCVFVFFSGIIINGLNSKSPIQAIDCPWRLSKRLPLKPSRWILGMGMSPWIFTMVYLLSGKNATFFVLHNFSLLIVIGFFYPVAYEIYLLSSFVRWEEVSRFFYKNILRDSHIQFHG